MLPFPCIYFLNFLFLLIYLVFFYFLSSSSILLNNFYWMIYFNLMEIEDSLSHNLLAHYITIKIIIYLLVYQHSRDSHVKMGFNEFLKKGNGLLWGWGEFWGIMNLLLIFVRILADFWKICQNSSRLLKFWQIFTGYLQIVTKFQKEFENFIIFFKFQISPKLPPTSTKKNFPECFFINIYLTFFSQSSVFLHFNKL